MVIRQPVIVVHIKPIDVTATILPRPAFPAIEPLTLRQTMAVPGRPPSIIPRYNPDSPARLKARRFLRSRRAPRGMEACNSPAGICGYE
jgi:hypothetical protein